MQSYCYFALYILPMRSIYLQSFIMISLVVLESCPGQDKRTNDRIRRRLSVHSSGSITNQEHWIDWNKLAFPTRTWTAKSSNQSSNPLYPTFSCHWQIVIVHLKNVSNSECRAMLLQCQHQPKKHTSVINEAITEFWFWQINCRKCTEKLIFDVSLMPYRQVMQHIKKSPLYLEWVIKELFWLFWW
jgi:hypothetical protein